MTRLFKPQRLSSNDSALKICFFFHISVCMLSYLVLAGVPVVQQACWDEERVVLMAALAVIPATIVTNLRLSSGQTNGTLTTWGGSHWWVCVCLQIWYFSVSECYQDNSKSHNLLFSPKTFESKSVFLLSLTHISSNCSFTKEIHICSCICYHGLISIAHTWC